MYKPPMTDARWVNIISGTTYAFLPDQQGLILFSTAEEDAAIIPLIKALDPAAQVSDGAGVVCPPIVYGSDGRRITRVTGQINQVPYDCVIGILACMRQWNPMWNGLRQPPYEVLYADPIAGGAELELHWGARK